ncbi:MAG: hypothetical protein J6K62_05360 [Clostridia bacterium]|nr:hypothetical protein [Clostridia bacterium]
MDESPIRKKSQPKKTTTTAKKAAPKSTSRKKVAGTAAETLKEALLEVRGLEASILEDVVIDEEVTASVAEESIVEVASDAVAEAEGAGEIARETADIASEKLAEEEPSVSKKIAKKPQRKRRKVRYAAPLGFLVLFLALTGLIALCVGGVRLVQKWTDDSELRAELSMFLDPVTQMCPTPFTDAGEAEDQDTLISSAIYSIAQPEYVRWLREGDSCTFSYERDELGRLLVPKKTVEKAFAHLFGEETIRAHHTVGDAEYNEDAACYHVPIQHTTAGYVPVLDTIDRDGDVYTVRVSYVLAQDIEYDYRGTALEPSADMGKYAQWFAVQKNEDDSWTILSVEAEEQQVK